MYKLFIKKKENLFAKFAKKDLVYQEPYKNIQCCITNNFENFFTEMPSYIFYLDEMIYLYNFSSKCNLKVHMENVHEGLKRFECEKCSQKFTERKALTLHIKGIHEKIKEFNCDRCDKFFF